MQRNPQAGSSADMPATREVRPRAIYYGWVNVVVASLAMTATLPGRTHGLGLITEPLLADLGFDHIWFARINFITALLGALFAVPAGWLIDRYGVRIVLATVTFALALSVMSMSRVEGTGSFVLTLLLVRGFGQSALSVASMAAIGKWFSRRLGMAMGLFAVLLTFGFIGSVLAMGVAVEQLGWRGAWRGLAYGLLVLVPVFWLFARSTPEACGLAPDDPFPDQENEHKPASYTLFEALGTRAFWVLALGSSAFNLVWSGVTLFNESMLAERGLGRQSAVEIMAVLTGTGLLGNLVAGQIADRNRIMKLLALGLALLTAALAVFSSIDSVLMARVYAALIGLSGGMITVVFFAAWGHLFGREHLGGIQGVAQFATVLASALGPVVLAEGRARFSTYSATFDLVAVAVAIIGVAAFVTPLPAARETGPGAHDESR